MNKCSAVGLLAALFLAAPLPAHAILLRYRPKINALTKHRIAADGTLTASSEETGQITEMEVTAHVDCREKALSDTAETTRVETRWIRGVVTAKTNGQVRTEQLATRRSVVEMDQRKRLLEIVEQDSQAGGEPGDPVGAALKAWAGLLGRLGALPEGDVAVGDFWSDELTFPAPAPSTDDILPRIPHDFGVEMLAPPGGFGRVVSARSELLALTTFQGRKCAKIRTSFEGCSAPDLSEPATPTGDVTFQGHLLRYYDYENAVEIYRELSARAEVRRGAISTVTALELKITLAE